MKRSPFLLGVIAALALCSMSARAQLKLTTLYTGGNGLSGSAAVYFDITVTGSVRITDFEISSYANASTPIDLQVYTCPSTYVGKESNQAAWTQVAQDDGKAVAAGINNPTAIKLKLPFVLTAGSYGMALVSNGGHSYTNGTGTNQTYQDNFLKLQLGASSSPPFGPSPITPRVWNGSILYSPASGIFANFTATPVSGPSPLQVQFTDTTFTSDPGGVTKWEWDFNADNVIDSTLQNPMHTFTGTTYDVKYTVVLKATDKTNGSHTESKKDYITVNPFPVGTATKFGQGSTNKPTNAPIDTGPHVTNYNASVRGFYFQAPTTLVVTGFRVPNVSSQPLQAVNFFTMPQKPPAYSTTYQLTANDVKFFAEAQKADTILIPPAPIIIQKDTWVGILGAGQASSGTTMYCSYGNPAVASTVLGFPVTLNRLLYQGSLAGRTDGLVPVSNEDAYQIARVEIFVAGNTVTPTLETIGTPSFATTPQFDLQARFPGAQVGLIFVATNRLPGPVTTPFGDLLILPNFILTLTIPNGTGQIGLPIPNDKNFAGVKLQNQAAVFDLVNSVYGMTNGVEWLIGL